VDFGKTLTVLSLVVFILFTGTSCQNSNSAQPPSPSSQTVTFTDALDRSVQLDRLPQRIVVAGKASFMILDALYMFPEGPGRLIAYSGGGSALNDPTRFLPLLDFNFSQKKAIGYQINPEEIAALKPDLVIMKSYLKKDGDSLETLGLKVAYLDLETPEAFFRDLKTLGDILGYQERASLIESFYQERLQMIKERLYSTTSHPSVLLAQYSQKGGSSSISVPPVSWIQTILVELAGGIPIWKEALPEGGWMIVNFEQIASWDPEKIFIIFYGGDPLQAKETLSKEDNWQALKALQNNQLFAFPCDLYSWDQADPRWILGLEFLAKNIHPELFSDLDLVEEAQSFFENIYLVQIDSWKNISSNLKGDLN